MTSIRIGAGLGRYRDKLGQAMAGACLRLAGEPTLDGLGAAETGPRAGWWPA